MNLSSIQDNTGRYYLVNKSKYPSVTTVLGSESKQAIQEWRQSVGVEFADAETKRCSIRGTEVHELIEQYLLNNPVDLTSAEYPKMFNQIRFRLNPISNIRLLEGALYSDRLRLAGRVDCVAEYKGVLSIIDFKTSTRYKSESMIQGYFLQCAAYAIMYQELYGEKIDQYVIIMAVEKEALPMVFVGEISPLIPLLVSKVFKYHKDQL